MFYDCHILVYIDDHDVSLNIPPSKKLLLRPSTITVFLAV